MDSSSDRKKDSEHDAERTGSTFVLCAACGFISPLDKICLERGFFCEKCYLNFGSREKLAKLSLKDQAGIRKNQARHSKDLNIAVKFLEEGHKADPQDESLAAELSSCLRKLRRADEAVALTGKYPNTENVALLTTRAAALEDVGALDLAWKVAGKAFAISKEKTGAASEYLDNLYRRLRADREASGIVE